MSPGPIPVAIMVLLTDAALNVQWSNLQGAFVRASPGLPIIDGVLISLALTKVKLVTLSQYEALDDRTIAPLAAVVAMVEPFPFNVIFLLFGIVTVLQVYDPVVEQITVSPLDALLSAICTVVELLQSTLFVAANDCVFDMALHKKTIKRYLLSLNMSLSPLFNQNYMYTP